MIQDLSRFRMPANFRGRHAVYVQLWWLAQSTLFRWSPQVAYPFRRWLLRCFGATVGRGVIIRPTVTVTYPWKVVIGDHAWIGDDVTLYSLGDINVGANAVVSQGSYLCGGDHDYTMVDFPIRGRPIRIEDEAWLGAQVFVGPGITVGRGTVVGARSSVFADLPPGQVCIGQPARVVKERKTTGRVSYDA